MTDNEIIKALKCCSRENCSGCPYHGKCHQGNPMIKDALDFINHQKTEIERLQKEVNLVSIQFQDVQEQYEEAQAEIEQWKEEANKYQKLWCIAIDDIETAKAKAYKEFAEKLENEINCRTTLSREQDKNVIHIIHNLLKEMVGEEE